MKQFSGGTIGNTLSCINMRCLLKKRFLILWNFCQLYAQFPLKRWTVLTIVVSRTSLKVIIVGLNFLSFSTNAHRVYKNVKKLETYSLRGIRYNKKVLECLGHLGLKMTSDYLLNSVNFSAYFLDHPSMAIFQEKPIIHYSIRYFATNQLLQFYMRNSRNFKSCFHITLFSQNVTDMLNENIFFDAQALLIKNLFQLTPVCPSAAASIHVSED